MVKSNYNISDCLTFGLVILFLLGALIAGPSIPPYNKQHLIKFPKRQLEIPGVDPVMIKLYNS
jgi:hypothetical protein